MSRNSERHSHRSPAGPIHHLLTAQLTLLLCKMRTMPASQSHLAYLEQCQRQVAQLMPPYAAVL